MLAAIRDLAGLLDGGQAPTADQAAAVADGANALLTRAGTSARIKVASDRNETIETSSSGHSASRPRRAPAAAPADRNETTEPGGPAHSASRAEPGPVALAADRNETTDTAAPRASRRARALITPPADRNETTETSAPAKGVNRPEPVPASDRHGTNELVDAMRANRAALEAAVRAVRTAPPDAVPAFVRASDGGWTVVMGDVPIGVLQPTYGVRSRSGWEARDIASMVPRGQHPTRAGAALLLADSLLRRPDIAGRPDDVAEATVRAWRETGETWAQIGARVGLSSRAASKRWGQTAAHRG